MSLPKHPLSHSSSPSKSSLRSASGIGTTQKPPSSRSLLPSPQFEEPHPHLPSNPPLDYGEATEEGLEDATAQPESSTFRPFFTLIEDTLTQSHHHPTVHYIFADDDTDIITEAACRSLAQDDTSMPTGLSQRQSREEEQEIEESKLPAPVDDVREHYLLLDVHADSQGVGYEVTRAHSLSSEWQILSTGISNAPTIDPVGPDEEGSDGLMLRIEGRGVMLEEDHNTGKGKSNTKRERETLEEMVARFERGLADIKRTIDAGGHLDTELSSKQEMDK